MDAQFKRNPRTCCNVRRERRDEQVRHGIPWLMFLLQRRNVCGRDKGMPSSFMEVLDHPHKTYATDDVNTENEMGVQNFQAAASCDGQPVFQSVMDEEPDVQSSVFRVHPRSKPRGRTGELHSEK